MSFPSIRRLRQALLPCALVFALLLLPTAHGKAATRASQSLKVDIHVTVHNSDIGVTKETLDDLVDKLLEEAHFQVEKEAADSAAIQLKIDIYREDGGKFKVVGDLDEPGGDDEDEKEDKETEAQDQIDDLVTAIVHDFIKHLHHS
jgi:hypothetical protein